MAETKSYEKFPGWIVAFSSLVTLLIYAMGAYILASLGILWLILYLLYCLGVEIEVLKRSCQDCYYYGQVCGFGKGKLCSLLFKKGNSQRFAQKEVSWVKVIPDFMVLLFPLGGGMVLLIREFSWFILIMLVILVFLCLAGNAFIRGLLVCKYCRQREIGCPAEKMFRKK